MRAQKPIAWIAFATDCSQSRYVCERQEVAEEVAKKYGWEVAPLGPWPQLTDEERAIIQACVELAEKAGVTAAVNTLRGLLERLGYKQ